MTRALRVGAAGAVTMLVGCAAPPPMTQSQMDAAQVRQVEAAPDRAFNAASGALIDAGYQVHVSDGEAGLLTGEKREDPAVAANVAVMVVTALLTNAPMDIPPAYHAVSIQVLPGSEGRSSVRIRPFLNGLACPCDQEDAAGRATVGQIWELMQRQLLMKEPAGAP